MIAKAASVGRCIEVVLRNAMRGRLPERTKAQAESSELAESILYAPQARARPRNLIMSKETDWLDSQRSAEWMDLPEQPSSSAPLHSYTSISIDYRSIWMIVGMDLWLESVLSSGGRF